MPGFDAVGKLAIGTVPSGAAPLTVYQSPPIFVRTWPIAAIALGSSMALLATDHPPFFNPFQAPINPILLAKVDQYHLNISNFAPAPFIPVDYNKPKSILLTPSQVYPNLVIAFGKPFFPYEMSFSRFQTPRAPDQVHSNYPLLFNQPVFPYDQSVYRTFSPRVPDQPYMNLPLLYGRPFIPVDYGQVHGVMLTQIPTFVGFQLLHAPSGIDTHDGVWVKRKRKKLGPDQIDLEVAEKASRRAALELAIYGPEVTYEPQTPVFESPKPLPDVTQLAKVIALAQANHHQAIRSQADQDEEADLEAILREVL